MTIEAPKLLKAIQTGTLLAVPSDGQSSHFPEIVLFFDGEEFATLRCIRSKPPQVTLDDGKTNVFIVPIPGMPWLIEIKCYSNEAAVTIANALSNCLTTSHESLAIRTSK